MIQQNINLKEQIQKKDLDVSLFLRFLEKIKLNQLLQKAKDPREEGKIYFPSSFLFLYALYVFFFRMESKNSLETSINCMPSKDQKKLLFSFQNDLEITRLPAMKTVDDFLKQMDLEALNEILFDLFLHFRKNKLFYNHLEEMGEGIFFLGCDGLHIHTYHEKHDEDCPYCLKRERLVNGKSTMFYFHVLAMFVLVFPCGLRLPLYIYPIHAKDVDLSLEEEAFKQECEYKAVLRTLLIIRQKLKRLSITLLLDGLFANEPPLLLARSLGFDYLIVKKEGSLKTLGKRLDELSSLPIYKKHYTKKEQVSSKQSRCYEWFNGELVGSCPTNILRFTEETRLKDGTIDVYHNEWLSSKKINAFNCRVIAQRGRMRWLQEDTNNSAKNRGFNLKHGYARKNPTLIMAWTYLLFIAFAIFEVFSCLVKAKEAQGKRSLKKFARDLFEQLVNCSFDAIFSAPIFVLKTKQFRFSFSGGPP